VLLIFFMGPLVAIIPDVLFSRGRRKTEDGRGLESRFQPPFQKSAMLSGTQAGFSIPAGAGPPQGAITKN
jgi:hypothetical protein